MMSIEVPPGIARMAEHFCGCGDPEAAWEVVLKELERLAFPFDERPELTEPDGYWYVVAYLIDHCGISTHGSSISGAWLDDDEPLAFLRKYGCDWQDSEDYEFFTRTPDGEMCVGGGKP